VSAGFPQDCTLCHTTANWTSATFNHSTTGFPLIGAHTTLQCAQCHVNNNYSLTSGACYPCHTADFNGTNNPPHVSAGFPQDCSLCHSTTNWTGATFNHTTTGFALTGFHTTLQCAQCHVNNNYSLASGTCYPCHTADFNGTNNPNHVSAGFPQDCSLCHTTTNWSGATFNHNNTPFPLTGAHVSVACTSCHINNVFAGTPTDCYSCHKADYTGTNNPNHVSAGFPTTCATCHTTTAWTGATFNHTWFPIASGRHANIACAVCHINSADYTVFSCTATCHSKTSTDPHHTGVRNYVWNATSCYGCHPTGNGG
jgi:predicted CXXCH cytochrome family protein